MRGKITYANVISTLALFLVVAGGSAVAANQLAKNSVGAKQIKKNAVTTAKIKKNAVSPAKIKKNAVTTAKIKNGAVTAAKIKDGAIGGAKVNAATLGKVPSAATADTATTAQNLAGQTPFFIRLGFGQEQVIATNGPVSFIASCAREGGEDFVRIIYASALDGSVADGYYDYNGNEGDVFGPGTPATERVLIYEDEDEGETYVTNYIDQGFVLAPNGKMLTTNSEGIVLGLNYLQPGCLVAGVANAIG